MLVNNNVNSPNFSALRIKKTPETIKLLHKASKQTLSDIQRAGEILGAPSEKNTTKYYDLTIEEFNHYGLWSDYELRYNISQNPGAYWGGFKNDKYYGSFSDYRIEKAQEHRALPDEKIQIRTNDHKYLGELNKSDSAYRPEGFFILSDRIYEENGISRVAKLLKIMDDVTVNKILGKGMSADEVKEPKITKPMSVRELIEKYGVEA